MTKAKKIEAFARAAIGSAYIYGATGQACTTSYREARAKQYPQYADKIRAYCQALSRGASCAGCRYQGRKAYDCAQLTRFAAKAAGIELVSGATSQWRKTDWLEQGTYAERPKGKLLLLFRANGSTMEHVGLMLPDGSTVDARGHAYGVLYTAPDKVTYKWTHYGILRGMNEEVDQMEQPKKTSKAVITCESGGWVNIRDGISGNVITRFHPGQEMEVHEQYGEWTKVTTTVTGYVMTKFLKEAEA